MNLLKNIEQKIKLSLIIAISSLVTVILVATISGYFTYRTISEEKKSIYVLSNNIPLQATRAAIADNRRAEYNGTIELFHNLFFSLPPDDAYIEAQMSKAMYLVDKSGIAQFNTLKEKGYYTGLVSTSSISTLITDSIIVDMETKTFRYFGTQKIERPSVITLRTLVTEGTLIDVPRSENNPHGVMITRWKTIENKDISTENKRIL